METTVAFTDLETSSDAFMVIRRGDDGIALGFGIEANGDLDFRVSHGDARRMAEALLVALADT